MDYIELDVKVFPRQPGSDLLISELAEKGFESFAETEDGFLAYIPAAQFSEALLSPVNEFAPDLGKADFSRKIIPSQNWNAEWEKSYEPILIDDKLCIRAPFHEPDPDAEIDLVIQPQQSFGTGHHPTTRLMAEKLLTMTLAERYVLDMGCGTGVLAILASELGASGVLGIDIESNAVDNARENVQRNKVVNVTIEEGKDDRIQDRKFDLILANINKNVLMNAMKVYSDAMKNNAELLLSGFFLTDVEELKLVAEKNGLKYKSTETDGEWALIHFTK
ncbi:MAG TPA: 50S ribosomal protein L11 methyltransferase [Bacteroidia bacterium]|nr:50S ribosomal protein L11 methyltransferase [Bacteroidia bacterium]